jgi:hypothetical protein
VSAEAIHSLQRCVPGFDHPLPIVHKTPRSPSMPTIPGVRRHTLRAPRELISNVMPRSHAIALQAFPDLRRHCETPPHHGGFARPSRRLDAIIRWQGTVRTIRIV